MSALIDTYKNVRASTEANGLVKADWAVEFPLYSMYNAP
jgi:hypothetical protein